MQSASDGQSYFQHVTCISFNHDASMFAISCVKNLNVTSQNCAKASGHANLASEILLYHTDPLILATTIYPGFVVRSIALLARTNILGLVPIQKNQNIENPEFYSSSSISSVNSEFIKRGTVFEALPIARRRHNELENAYLYDCHLKEITQKFSFKQPVGQCLLSFVGSQNNNQIRFVVICRESVFIFSTMTGHKKDLQPGESAPMHKLSFDTGPNEKQLGAIDLRGGILICPASKSLVAQTKHGRQIGNNQKDLPKTGVLKICNLGNKEVQTLVAHKRELAYCALDFSGKKCATAGILGTLIRVWGTENRNLLYELRRGTDPANIFGFSFCSLGSMNSDRLLAGGSDKGTVHIWKTHGDVNLTKNSSKKIEAGIRGGSGENGLLSELAQGIVSSSNERRSTCSFSVRQDEASIVKIMQIRPGLQAAPVMESSSSRGSLSSNLCAIVVTKGGFYYKYHVDLVRQVTGKMVKENLFENGQNMGFG